MVDEAFPSSCSWPCGASGAEPRAQRFRPEETREKYVPITGKADDSRKTGYFLHLESPVVYLMDRTPS
jgi:hypothetical protein